MDGRKAAKKKGGVWSRYKQAFCLAQMVVPDKTQAKILPGFPLLFLVSSRQFLGDSGPLTRNTSLAPLQRLQVLL